MEEIPDEDSLPPTLDPPGCGIIWVPCGNGVEAQNKGMNTVKNVLLELKNEPSVAIVYNPFGKGTKMFITLIILQLYIYMLD